LVRAWHPKGEQGAIASLQDLSVKRMRLLVGQEDFAKIKPSA
jgi:hypothetical protein